MENIAIIIGINLTKLRKNAKLTQLEVGEKLNYSDKTISKWENGECLPSIEVLYAVAQLYGVKLDDLTREDFSCEEIEIKPKFVRKNKVGLAFLSTTPIWCSATLLFLLFDVIKSVNVWTAFVWAVPMSCIVLLVFACVWRKRKLIFWIVSVLTWTLLGAVYLQFLSYNIWRVFFVGIPMQLAICLWSITTHKYD
ncbi:MAG: helix-turn-helix transcriptional regulator [Clostridia bacterium]